MIDGMLFPARCAVSPYQRLYSQSLARGYYGKGGLKMKAGGWPGVPVGAGVQWEAWIPHFGYQWPWYTDSGQGICLRLARGLGHWSKFVRSSTVLPPSPHISTNASSLPCPREEERRPSSQSFAHKVFSVPSSVHTNSAQVSAASLGDVVCFMWEILSSSLPGFQLIRGPALFAAMSPWTLSPGNIPHVISSLVRRTQLRQYSVGLLPSPGRGDCGRLARGCLGLH